MSNSYMVQYGIWPNCCNKCEFCLIKEEFLLTKQQQIDTIDTIIENISYIDWKDKFSCGISLLGGELYYIKDKELQDKILELIDVIIEKILKVSTNPNCRYSTVTNGIYDPEFLYKVVDKIVDAVGIQKVDMNFSYDLDFRFKNEDDAKLVLKNINDFHKRYNYRVGVQMIMTQKLINRWKSGEFDVNKFIEENIPDNNLCFLYPHPIYRGNRNLQDFYFNRKDFIDFVEYLKKANRDVFISFINSTKNSAIFKYTGYTKYSDKFDCVDNQPKLLDGKEEIQKCGHSILYKCYSDCDRCMMCDLKQLDEGEYL